jgi:DnaJ-domain-containing protein 1
MTTPAEYHQFALDCLGLAKLARSPSERQILTDMARLWRQIAARMEDHLILAADKEKLLAQLRAKLD